MRSVRWRGVLIAGGLVCALWMPAAAAAAVKPVARTGGVANLTPTSVVLKGRVSPKGAATTYLFQYGTTSLYGATTAWTAAGSGTTGRAVAVAVGALAPATTYHYRLVAQNAEGMTRGRDRTFRTRRQPLGVTLAATPNPIRAGGAVTLAGVLTGTGNANRQIALQANPWPYTGGFLQVGNTLLTNAQGGFAFPLLAVGVNTQYRVLMPSRPVVASPVVVLGTTVTVSRHVKVRRFARRGRLRFRGRITPATDGGAVLIQKRRNGVWTTIARTAARYTGHGFSRYVKRVRQRRGGRYRVVVADVTGAHSPSVSRSVRIRRVRR
jgi:hypothetical protein